MRPRNGASYVPWSAVRQHPSNRATTPVGILLLIFEWAYIVARGDTTAGLSDNPADLTGYIGDALHLSAFGA